MLISAYNIIKNKKMTEIHTDTDPQASQWKAPTPETRATAAQVLGLKDGEFTVHRTVRDADGNVVKGAFTEDTGWTVDAVGYNDHNVRVALLVKPLEGVDPNQWEVKTISVDRLLSWQPKSEDLDATIPNGKLAEQLRVGAETLHQAGPVVEKAGEVATGAVVQAPESPIKRALRAQITAIENGEGVPHIIAIPKEAEPATAEEAPAPEEEAEGEAEEEVQAEQSRSELLAEAFSSPQSLLEALANPEFPQDVKQKLAELVGTMRDAVNAKAVEKIWEEEVAPRFRNIAGETVEEVRRATMRIASQLEETTHGLRGLMHAVHEGNPEDVRRYMNRLGLGELAQEMATGRYKRGLQEALYGQTRGASMAQMLDEERQHTARSLGRKRGEPLSPEEAERITSMLGADAAQDPEAALDAAIGAAKTEVADTNWRERENIIEEVALLARRTNFHETVQDRTHEESRVRQIIEEIEDMVRRGRYRADELDHHIRMLSQNLASIQEQFDGVKRMAMRVGQVAESVRRT